jgi:hypothetical protein
MITAMMMMMMMIQPNDAAVLVASGRVMRQESIRFTVSGFPLIISMSSFNYSPRIYSLYSMS